jgi:hypothetical protein
MARTYRAGPEDAMTSEVMVLAAAGGVGSTNW